MRRFLLPLLLAALLGSAGCFTPAASTDPPLDTAAEPPAGSPATSEPPADGPSDASAEGSAASAPAEEEAPPADESAAPEEPESAAAPAAVPWTVAESLALGWAQAVGAAGTPAEADAPSAGVEDAEHCAAGAFDVPAGASSLRLVLAGAPASPDPALGFLVVDVTAPDGTVHRLDPAPAPGEMSAQLTIDAPPSGAWAVAAMAKGPVVGQRWTLTVEAAGESSDAPPTTLAAQHACAA